MKRLGPALAVVSLALAACTIGPDYHRPAVPEAQRYPHGGTSADLMNPDIAWWRAFGDPVLASLVDEAMRNNYDARVAAARIEQFRGQMETARAGLFPQLGATLGASREQQSTFAGTPLASLDRPGNHYQVLGNVSWEIDLWGKIRRQTEAAKADLWAEEYSRRGVELSLAASVAQTYLSLRGLDAQLAIARQTLDARAHDLAIFKLRYEHGVISEMELSQAQDEFYAADGAIPTLHENIAQTENALSLLLGRPPGPIPRGKTLEEMQHPPLDADPPASLLNRRPDLLQAEQNAIAANALVGAAEALYLPSLSLSAFLGQGAGSMATLWSSASRIWGLSAGLTQPLFEGGAIHGQVRAARSESVQAVLTYQGAILSAMEDVDNALVAARELERRQISLEGEQRALTIYANQSNARYEGGYSSYLEVTSAEEKLFSAQLAAVQGQVAVLTSYVTLYKALGGGWSAVPEDVRNAGESAVTPSLPRKDNVSS